MRIQPPSGCSRVTPRHRLWLHGLLGALLLISTGPIAAEGLLVVSRATEQVLRYDPTSGAFLEVFIEPVTAGFQTPAGIALQPSSGDLYVSSAGGGEIWRYVTATGQVVTPAATSGLLQPGALGFEPSGDSLFFIEPTDGLSATQDAVKRLVIATSTVSTVGTESLTNFSGLAVNATDVYASDSVGGSVFSFPVSGGSGSVEISGLSFPGALLFRSPTRLLIAEMGTNRVLEYLESNGSWIFDRVVVETAAGVDGPAGLAIAPDASLTVSCQFSHEVVSVDLGTLVVTPLVAESAGGLRNPGAVAWNGSTLLVASLSSNAILYFDASGVPTGTVAKGLSPPIDAAMGLSASGSLVVPSSLNNDLVEYDAEGGGLLRQYFDACPSSFDSPYDVTFGPDGDLYTSCQFSNSIHRFDTTTGNPAGFFVTSGAGGLVFPQGLSFGPGGNLFVASSATNEVLEYDGVTGSFESVFVPAAPLNPGLDPVDLEFHEGALYVSFRGSDQVRDYDALDGTPLGIFVSTRSGGLDSPAGLTFGPSGNLYVGSLATDEVLEYDGASGAFISAFVSAGSGGLDGPIDLVFVPEPGFGGALAWSLVALQCLRLFGRSRR